MEINPKTGKIWREDADTDDVFVHRDEKGKVQTFIRCSNAKVARPPCTHHFHLPNDMKAWVYLSYNRHILAEWQKYEENTIKLVNSFRVDDAVSKGENHD